MGHLRGMSLPIALQLYSVRNDCQADLFGVLKQVAAMGYNGVEFAGYYGHDPKEIKKALDDLGLKAEGTHTPIGDFSDENFEKMVETHKTLGAEFAIIPWIPEDMRNSVDAAHLTAVKLTELASKVSEVGLRTGFHAHEGDMHPLPGGTTAWDILAGGTPTSFIMQYDTANGMSVGADPVKPILEWPGRAVSVHLKAEESSYVGEGAIPWEEVFKACETIGGTQWYVVEHEAESELTPLESVKRCIDNLRKLGK